MFEKYKPSDILVDMHTHTIFSKHAYSSISENLAVAERRGLGFIAITDHYYENGDVIDKKNEKTRIKYMESNINRPDHPVYVIGSAEFNLGQNIEVFDKYRDLLWRPIGLHTWFVDIPNLNLEQVYNLYMNAWADDFNAFVHIERELHKVNQGRCEVSELDQFLRKVVKFAKEKNIWLEVNESSILVDEGGGAARLAKWLAFAKDNGNKICLGTDAHYMDAVGDFSHALELLNILDYPKELVLNVNEDQIKKYCKYLSL